MGGDVVVVVDVEEVVDVDTAVDGVADSVDDEGLVSAAAPCEFEPEQLAATIRAPHSRIVRTPPVLEMRRPVSNDLGADSGGNMRSDYAGFGIWSRSGRTVVDGSFRFDRIRRG